MPDFPRLSALCDWTQRGKADKLNARGQDDIATARDGFVPMDQILRPATRPVMEAIFASQRAAAQADPVVPRALRADRLTRLETALTEAAPAPIAAMTAAISSSAWNVLIPKFLRRARP